MNKNLRFAVVSFLILVGLVAISAADSIVDTMLATTTSAEHSEEVEMRSVTLLPGQIYVLIADFQGPDGVLTPINEIEAEEKTEAPYKEALDTFTETMHEDGITTSVEGEAVIFI